MMNLTSSSQASDPCRRGLYRAVVATVSLVVLASAAAAGAPLAGTYTIGGADPHFLTLQAATAALAAEGISGPVVFDIRPGTYEAPVVVQDVVGASAVNTIVFQSETANAADVVVASDGGGVWYVSGDWVTLQHLTLQQQVVPDGDYARVLEVSGDVNHVNILHNRLIGTPATTTIPDRHAVLFNWKTSTYAADDILIEGNEILNGSVGIYWGGSTLFSGSGLRIRNNSVREFGMNGIQLLMEPAAEVIGNEISTSVSWWTYPYGLFLEYCHGPVRIEKNRISVVKYLGLGVREALATAEAPAIIANNFVRVGEPASIGLNLYESEYQHVLHNTVAISGQFASSPAINVYYGAHNLLLGNIATNDAQGAAIKITFPDTNVDDSDSNLFHSADGLVGITSTFDQHPTLADWQAATGLDANSVEALPLFVAPDDLHLAFGSPGIDQALPGIVADDIDYALRPAEADIGADEEGFAACEFLVAVTDAHCPTDDGAIDLTAIAGEPPFTFAWSDGADTEDRIDLAPGPYSVTVTNDGGCDWSETIEVGCLPDEPLLQLTLETAVDVTCNGECDGILEVSATGGCPPYAYSVKGAGSPWRASTGYEDSLCAGRYDFRVRDSCGNGERLRADLVEPSPIEARLKSRENVSCRGESDGSFELQARGGVTPFRFSKDGGVLWQDSGYFDGLPAAVYPARIEDANECELDRDVRISAPPELLLKVVSITDESFPGAADGAIEVGSSGGTGDPEYSIDGGLNWQASPIFSGLTAGAYIVVVQDENSCMRSVEAVVG